MFLNEHKTRRVCFVRTYQFKNKNVILRFFKQRFIDSIKTTILLV